MREKLIELLRTVCAVDKYCHGHCIECTADHLIAHGVTIQDREEIDFDYAAEVE